MSRLERLVGRNSAKRVLRRSARRVAVRQSAQYAGAIPPCAVASLVLLAAIGTADAADIPIGGTYGTVAMCIIDAFTDVPSAEINYNVGGAPLARVLPGEFDLPTQSCVFQRILSASTSGSKPHWVVEAQCTTETGNVAKVLDLTADKVAHAVAVAEKDGKVLATVDQCSVPYRERLARELKRMAGKSDAAQ